MFGGSLELSLDGVRGICVVLCRCGCVGDGVVTPDVWNGGGVTTLRVRYGCVWVVSSGVRASVVVMIVVKDGFVIVVDCRVVRVEY